MQVASLIKLSVMYLAMKENQDETLVEAMGKRADNLVSNKLVMSFGKEKVNKTLNNN